MSPLNLSRRERRERLRPMKNKDEGDGSRSLHRVRRSGRGRGRGRRSRRCSVISLKKRAMLSHLHQRCRVKAAVTTPSVSPEKKESFSSRFFSNPSIRWAEEERDLGVLGKHKYEVGSVFDAQSNSWVVKYNIVVDPMAPWSNGIPGKITCDVCGKSGHLHTTCALTFDYPPHAPHFNREDYELVCECGSNDITPGSWNCNGCQPNCGLRVQPKELPPLLEFEDPNPDPSSFTPLVMLPGKSKFKFSVSHSGFPVLSS